MVYYNYINILIRLPGDSPCRRAGKKGFPMPLSFLDELNDIWKMVRDSFRKELSNTVTDLFLGDLSVTGIEDDTTIILTGDSVIKMRTVNLKYREEIEKRFSDILGYPVTVRLVSESACNEIARQKGYTLNERMIVLEPDAETNKADGEGDVSVCGAAPNLPGRTTSGTAPDSPAGNAENSPAAGIRSEQAFPTPAEVPAPAEAADKPDTVGHLPPSTLPPFNFEYTFDNFIVGSSNKFAHAACLAVADHPAQNYNPLFIYGNSGLGKTHLLNAICHEIKRNDPSMKIVLTDGEEFTNEFIEALNHRTTTEFQNKYRKVDVLLMDDVQFIASKERTQEEFFHTFNALHAAHKQIILSSDKPPKEMETLDERFRSRFEWGLIADIQPPDYETRMAILRKNAETYDRQIDEEIIKYIATNIKSNIRELEGAFNKIIAFAKLNKVDLTLSLAEEALKDVIYPNKPKEITPTLIINVVAEHFGVKAEDITSKKRNSEFVQPRQVVMYLCRELTDTSFTNIGKLLGKKDHTTIIHGVNKVAAEIQTNEELRNKIDIITKKINPS